MRFGLPEQDDIVNFQIAPMADVVLMILIFFLASATLSQSETSSEVFLPVADASQPKKNEGAAQIIINVRKDGKIEVGGNLYEVRDVASELRRVASEKDIGLDKRVIIRGDKDTHYGRIMRLMAACADADLWNISFGTYPEDMGERPSESTTNP